MMENPEEELWCSFLQAAPSSNLLCPVHHQEQGNSLFKQSGNWIEPLELGHEGQQWLILEKLSHLTNPVLFPLLEFDVLKN